MLIRIRYTAGTFDYVSHASLDYLIRDHKITQFFRSSGWAVIGVDPIRTNDTARFYIGPERRGETGSRFSGPCLANLL